MNLLSSGLIQLTSKSRYITRKTCARKGYYSNELGGHGIKPVKTAEYLSIGKSWHDAMERILRGEDYATVAAEEAERLKTSLTSSKKAWGEEEPHLQWARWMEGMVYAAGKYIIPSILAEYEIVSVEEETKFDLPPQLEIMDPPPPIVRLIGRPDLVLKRKLDGTYWYWEWKTTGWTDSRWLRQWDKDIQLQGAAKAIAATQGIEIQGCVVQGVYKGYIKEGVMSHPFVYAYASQAILGAMEGWQVKYDRRLMKLGTDVYPGGVQAWVDYLYDTQSQVVTDQFPRTLPITINERLVDRYFAQLWWDECRLWYARNNHIPDVDGDYLDQYYPQNFWECEPSIGAKCEFGDCCWNPEVGSDPVGSGLYELREPRVVEEEASAV